MKQHGKLTKKSKTEKSSNDFLFTQVGFDNMGLSQTLVKELKILREMREKDHESFELQSIIGSDGLPRKKNFQELQKTWPFHFGVPERGHNKQQMKLLEKTNKLESNTASRQQV